MPATTTADRPAPVPSAVPPATVASAAALAPRTRAIGAAFVAAPVLAVASSAALVAGAEGAWGVLGFYAFALFALVVLTLTSALAAPFPRAAALLTLTGVCGIAAGVGFMVDGLHGELVDGAYLIDEGGLAGVLVSQVPGLMFPATCLGIGVALLRCGLVPRATALALIVAAVLFPVSRIGEIAPLALVDDVVFLLALAPLGLAIMRGREPLAGRPVRAR